MIFRNKSLRMATYRLWQAVLLARVVCGELPEIEGQQKGNLSINAAFTPTPQPAISQAPNQVECWKQWRSYSELTSSLKASSCNIKKTTLSTTTFQTLVEIGETSLYSLPCETGITRVKFMKKPTRTTVSTFSVVQTRVDETNEFCEYEGDAKKPDCEPDYRFQHSTCVGKWKNYKKMVVAASARNDFDFYAHTTASGYPDMKGCPADTHPFCVVDPGADVAIIYWPPEVTSRDVCANGGAGTAATITRSATGPMRTVVTSAITLKGPDLYDEFQWQWDMGPPGEPVPATQTVSWPGTYVIKGPHTFVSPTVYLAHRTISVKDYDGSLTFGDNGTLEDQLGWGERRAYVAKEPGIIALSPNDVYSLRQRNRIPIPSNYPELVAKGEFDNPFLAELSKDIDISPEVFDILPFDYGNLADPVPASVYYDARAHDCWGNQSHCATITDGSYRPQLAFRREFWAGVIKDYWGGGCFRPEVNDPPIGAIPADPAKMNVVLPTFGADGIAQIPDEAQPKPGSFVDAPWPQATPMAMSGGGGQDGQGGGNRDGKIEGGNQVGHESGSFHAGSSNLQSNSPGVGPAVENNQGANALSTFQDSNTEGGSSHGSGIEVSYPLDPNNPGADSLADHSLNYATHPMDIDLLSPDSNAYVVKVANIANIASGGAVTGSSPQAPFIAATIHDGQTTTIAGKVISAVKGAVYVDGEEIIFASPDESGTLGSGDEKGGAAGEISLGKSTSWQRTKTLMVYNTVSRKSQGTRSPTYSSLSPPEGTAGSSKKKSEGVVVKHSLLVSNILACLLVVLVLFL